MEERANEGTVGFSVSRTVLLCLCRGYATVTTSVCLEILNMDVLSNRKSVLLSSTNVSTAPFLPPLWSASDPGSAVETVLLWVLSWTMLESLFHSRG